ncbi:MAG: TonB-dependent receptor [Gammaproteobacteria bacterium]|nr:TonB-dependent receptor [Gammaproteobacteria bacterium]
MKTSFFGCHTRPTGGISMKSTKLTRAVSLALASSFVLPVTVPVIYAEESAIEEVLVTARRREETLQDVPVTVAALTEEDLDRYQINTLTDASRLVPNFSIFHGGSGNGSNIILRGIGSSSISAAFDQSVAINVDGVVVNIGRFIHNAYMDMGQIEVLKGPQSLYFGKSATAGVVSITTNDPGQEWEGEAMIGYETEHDQEYYEAVISGPITDTLGIRGVFGKTNSNELFKNLVPGVQHPYRGEESTNGRVTLVWEPNDVFKSRLKYAYSEYNNDGANGRTEEFCPEGRVQPTAIPAAGFVLALFPGIDDCKLNGNTSINDLIPPLRRGLPYGGDDGVPFLEQDTHFISWKNDWDITPTLALEAITGYVDLDHRELDIYDYSAGVFGGLHRNTYESISQELRLSSNFDGPLNFQLGAFYQDVEQTFEAYQYAFNLGAIFGPDPVTGNQYDYNKNHFLDTKVFSSYFAGYWDVIPEVLQVTAGVRYTDEEKDGFITIPYMHAAAALFGFGAPALVEGLTFDDDNLSPEVAVNWYITPDVSVFGSYKEGFKSGGVDNSALPTNSLDPAQNPDFPDFLIYDSEEASGFEFGVKADMLDGSLRVNASVFQYKYDGLQVQLFNSQTIQFQTFNASELTTEGLEMDLFYVTPIEGLTLRGAIAWTDTSYTKDFINATGENLKGQDGALSAETAGSAGLSYDFALSDAWRMDVSLDGRYNGGYAFTATKDPLKQESFWLVDAAIRAYSADDRYELALIGRNLTDEIYAQGAGARPGACFRANPAGGPFATCTPTIANNQDQVVTTSLGVEYVLQFRVRF